VGKLNVLVTERNKYGIGLAALLFFTFLYSTTNSLSPGVPEVLPPLWVDQQIPLLPATIWVYASYLLVPLLAFILEKDCVQLTRFVYAQVAVNLLCNAIYVLWPTTFLRPELTGQDGISVLALELVWFLDAPVNCFPSLHVSSTLVAVFMLWRSRSRLWPFFLLWTLAISISTMTTKQHHSADVVAGVLVAASMSWLFFVRASYRPRTRPVIKAVGAGVRVG
jgi:membrane-associated phospholipid phosphatase